MESRISIHTTAPLTGTASAGTGDPLPFEGWRELLRALATLTGAVGYPVAQRPAAVQRRPTREAGEEASNERDDNGNVDNGAY